MTKTLTGYVCLVLGLALLFTSGLASGGALELDGAGKHGAVVVASAGGVATLVTAWWLLREPPRARRRAARSKP